MAHAVVTASDRHLGNLPDSQHNSERTVRDNTLGCYQKLNCQEVAGWSLTSYIIWAQFLKAPKKHGNLLLLKSMAIILTHRVSNLTKTLKVHFKGKVVSGMLQYLCQHLVKHRGGLSPRDRIYTHGKKLNHPGIKGSIFWLLRVLLKTYNQMGKWWKNLHVFWDRHRTPD